MYPDIDRTHAGVGIYDVCIGNLLNSPCKLISITLFAWDIEGLRADYQDIHFRAFAEDGIDKLGAGGAEMTAVTQKKQ